MSWKTFWNQYRKIPIEKEDDLLVQVGRTVNKLPIPQYKSDLILSRIREHLNLDKKNILLDICCGNGIYTSALSENVSMVFGIDFSDHLIQAARDYKSGSNIQYHALDALTPIPGYLPVHQYPDRVLMNAALAYFSQAQLQTLLENICAVNINRPWMFLITDIPNHHLMGNFYNTPERQRRFEENQSKEFNDNDGMGRWWKYEEIEECTEPLGLTARLIVQPPELSDYRMDVLISSSTGQLMA